MVGSRERRPRGRKKVHYEEVLPSTDLPPLVQGDLRCFLIVDIGKIHWSSTTTAQVPPASPAYVRLRWWGETSDGTLFKPASARDDRIVKSRCRFGVRSGAKQMSAYFMDMGSIVLEVLTSPKSVPLGRVQIPKVAHLSSDNPICNYFKIISPSSRNVGEIHVRIRFRPLEDAYSMTTDTATDTSMSSRSRPPSEVGRRSRSRGSSVGSRSNIGSARSRSSSGGSRKGRKKRSSSRSKTRGRSRSSESNASSASKRSQQARKASTVDSATPRGIDDMLRMNGHDFYGAETNPRSNAAPVRSDSAQHSDRRTGRRTKGTSGSAEDAISALLKKGNRLREDMMKSQVDSDPAKARIPVFETAIPNKIERPVQPEMPTRHPAVPDSNQAFVPTNMQQVQTIPKTIDPIKEVRQDLDMRFVDLVFGSQEFKGHPGSLSFLSGLVTPPPGSPLGSMISEFEDNPLHDESLLQQMFYNNGASLSAHDMQRVNDKLREIQKVPPDDNQNQQFDAAKTYNVPAKVHFHDQPRAPQVPRILSAIPGLSSRRLQTLHHVHLVRVAIETLKLPPDDISTPSKRRPKKGRGRGSKPPVPSPSRKQKVGTYFVEFKLPVVEENPREHPSSMTTSHEVTRVASRKLLNTEDRTVVFDEVCEFPIQLADANLLKWSRESVEFFICHRKLADKKASLLGVAEVPLNEILRSDSMGLTFELNVVDDHRSCGTLKVSFDLIGNHSVEVEDPITEDDTVKAAEKKKPEQIEEVESTAPEVAGDRYDVTAERQDSSIAISPSTSVLYMMLLVEEGIDLPGTTVISPTHGPSSQPPNVFLVFRTLAPGENEKTPIVWGESNPKFDFVQVLPLKLENALLSRMKNNFVIIEVWTRITSSESHSDKLLGLVKISTHHFYQSLRDEEISRVVLKSQHPLISVDESVSVIDLFTGQERGKLQVTLALGTQSQIATLRKVKSDTHGKATKRQHHLEDKNTEHDSPPGGPVEHTFELNIVRLDGFKPLDNQVWGETDCFIQYQFPTQRASDDTEVDASMDQEKMQNLNFASMQNFRSDATLCVPDPVFNDARRHTFRPPPSLPVQRILLSSCYTDGVNGGIPFELWSRYYHPNVRDQLLAKGLLPIAKVSALVTMTTNKVSEQTFHVPLEFVDPEEMHDDSAGRLEVLVKYRASGTALESTQPAMQFSKPVILRVGLLRACGLKAALRMACRHNDDDDELKQATDVGPNTYVKIKPTFLPDEDARTSRLVAQSFAPEYQHHVEIACPLVSYHRDVTPISLAELLVSGEVEFSVWHRSSAEDDGRCGREKDVLLGTFALSTRPLLRKSTGLHSWFSLETPERYRRHVDSHSDMGALEISVSFSHSSDLDSILRAGKAAAWSLPHFESRLLGDASATSDDVTKTEHVTFSVTVTNAWLPKPELLLHGRTSIDKSASAYLRYKFFDHDSVTSSLCPLVAKQPHSVEARFENLVSARIAHKKSFVCKRSRPLVWFLREEKLELQIWLTHTSAEKKRRPTDADKLLGVCCVDLSTIDFAKEQHISGSFKLFRMGSDDLGDGKVRVYVSMKPGAITDPEPDPVAPRLHDSDEEVALSPKASTISLQAQFLESVSFPAVVTVERAMHLPLVGDLETDKHAEPNCYASFEVVDTSAVIGEPEHDMGAELKTVTMTTKMTMAMSSPVWNEVSEVNLPKQLLSGAHGAFLLKVWHRDTLYFNQPELAESAAGYSKPELSASAAKVELMATDRMLGFATVDLSVLRAGLRDVNGWYNVLDIHGQCQGQLKVAVTPSKLPPPSEPASARTQDTKLDTGPEFISTTMKFLNQAPVNIPIQTPSGSMYYPGLQSSAQTVKATCKMSETEELNFLQSHQQLSAFVPPLPQASNGPSASMFRYASSDRQQACLVNTLQKQIQELEEIKKRFQQRRAAGFGTSDRENESQNLHADSGREGAMQNASDNIEHSSDHPLQHSQRNDTRKNEIKARKDPENLTNMTSSDSMGNPNLREKKNRHVREQQSMKHDSLSSRPPRTSKVTYEKSEDDDDLENVSPRSTETLTSIPSDRPSPKTNRNDPSMNGGEIIHDLHPNMTSEFRAPPDLENVEVDRSNDTSCPVPSAGPHATFTHPLQSSEFTKTLTSAGHGNAVHLSLYEKRKSPEFGDHAFSDNEASSDVEFVQPRSLNEEHATDFRESHDKESDDDISDLEESAENPRHVPVPSALTPARSEGHSALENTSLWLSGSTLRVSGLSSDAEDDDQHKSESKSDKSQDAIPLKMDEFEEERSEKEEHIHDSEEQKLVPEEDQEEVDEVDAETLPEDPAKSSKPAEVIVLEDEPQEPDNHHNALRSDQESTESVADDHTEDDQCTEEEEESLPLEDQTSDNSVPAFSDPSMNTADNRKNGKPVTVKSSDVFKPIPNPELQNSTLKNKPQPIKKPTEGTVTHTDGRENDENMCPNTLAKQRNVQLPPRGRLFPNFFPPTRDLEASMRALQEATTKHKHDLLKKKQSDKPEEKSPSKKTDIIKQPSPRTRKLPPKPEDFSDERTKRLARIFRTKFS